MHLVVGKDCEESRIEKTCSILDISFLGVGRSPENDETFGRQPKAVPRFVKEMLERRFVGHLDVIFDLNECLNFIKLERRRRIA